MKILLLTPDLPYPSESGAALRNMGIIRGLKSAGHAVTLLSFRADAAEPASSPLASLCAAVHTAPLPARARKDRLITLLTSSQADLESRLASAEYERSLRQLLRSESFDIVQFSGIELGGYLELILSQKGGAKVIYDALNAEADLQRVIARVDVGEIKRIPAALYSSIQARRLARFEAGVCAGVDAVIAVSSEDRDLLQRYRGAPVTVMSNGVEVADYRPPPGNVRSQRQIMFSGKMDYRPNVDAAEWLGKVILPRVWDSEPSACLSIVGRNPHQRLRVLADDQRIRLTGWVESVMPFLQEAALFVVPLRMGSGTRLKILQAMAAGCAVLSTSIGAAGLNSEVRGALEIADDADDFARAIAGLLQDDARRQELGARALQVVGEYYDWRVLMPKLLRVYESLAGDE